MRYMRTLLKHWYLYMLPVVVIPVVLASYGYSQHPMYQSTALLYVDRPAFLSSQDFGWNPNATPAQNEAMAMSELLQSATFSEAVAAHTPLAKVYNLNTQAGKDAAAGRISSEVTITASTIGPHTIWVSATDTSPRLAHDIVIALLAQYTANYQDHRLELDQQAVTYYEPLLAAAERQVAQDTQRLRAYQRQHLGSLNSRLGTDPQLAQLQNQLNQDQTRVNNFTNQLDALRQDAQAAPAAASDLFKVLDPPQVPLQPTISEKKLLATYIGVGLAGALALVAVIVAGLTLLDRKIYTTGELHVIADDLKLDLLAIESLPLLTRTRRRRIEGGAREGEMDDILLPALAAPGRHMSGPTQQEPRQAVGVRDTALQGIGDAGDDA